MLRLLEKTMDLFQELYAKSKVMMKMLKWMLCLKKSFKNEMFDERSSISNEIV